jgi:hypothetical protein
MSSPFQKKFSAKSPLNQVDPDAPGTPGTEGYEPPVNREELDPKGKEIYDNLRKENNQTTVGENTSEVKKDKKGKYVLRSERSVAGAKGDTIRIPNNKFIEDDYLIGGDYETKKTGNKSFEITKQK